MRFEVPQFIEVEARIIGPLTWKQFVYVGGGIGALVILYLVAPFIVFVLVGIPIGILSASLAFHRINNRPFSYFIEAMVNYFFKNKLHLWKRGMQQAIVHKAETETTENPLILTNQKTINSLSHNLETRTPYQQE